MGGDEDVVTKCRTVSEFRHDGWSEIPHIRRFAYGLTHQGWARMMMKRSVVNRKDAWPRLAKRKYCFGELAATGPGGFFVTLPYRLKALFSMLM